VSFLRKTKRLRYFFKLNFDGGDALKNIYNYFSDKNNGDQPNYFKYFYENSCMKPAYPVILFLDNETKSKKPLKDFLGHINADEERKKLLSQKLHIKLVENSNLFLMTHNLVDNKEECELEDLFPDETLKHKIRGKSFCRNADSSQLDMYYGKDIFSRYIQANYKNINFDGFKIVLNTINDTLNYDDNNS